MRSWIAGALPLLLMLSPREATAQVPEREVLASDRAVQLGHSALQEYERGAWQAAYANLVAAEQLAHSPVFALYMARCQRELGQLLASKALYEAVVREQPSPDAPRAFHDARFAARAELLELRARIPTVVLSTKPGLPSSAPVLIRVDGRTLADWRLSAPIEIDAGRHQIEIAAAHLRGFVAIELHPGQLAVPVELTLSSSPTLGAQGEAAMPARKVVHSGLPAARLAVPAPPKPSTGWAPLVGFAVGATGLLVGAVSGIVAWSEMRKLRADCPGDACQRGDEYRRDRVRTFADVSTIGFATGGLGIGVGLTLMFAQPASKPVNGVSSVAPVAALSLQGEL